MTVQKMIGMHQRITPMASWARPANRESCLARISSTDPIRLVEFVASLESRPVRPSTMYSMLQTRSQPKDFVQNNRATALETPSSTSNDSLWLFGYLAEVTCGTN